MSHLKTKKRRSVSPRVFGSGLVSKAFCKMSNQLDEAVHSYCRFHWVLFDSQQPSDFTSSSSSRLKHFAPKSDRDVTERTRRGEKILK